MADTYPKSPAKQIPAQFAGRIKALQTAGRIAFVTPSRWLANEAKRGMLKNHEVRAIPNSVELDRFSPVDREAARHALDLPTSRPVLITSARMGDPRKGAAVLYAALEKLARPNTILLQLGGTTPSEAEGRWNHRVLESIHDPRLLRLAYSAADAHILPTLADNLPNTLLEAAACGVPSIASDVGGVGEAIDPGNTGWLVAPGDAGALAKQIGRVIDEAAASMDDRRRACRAFAESRFAPALQARRYTELFERTIGYDVTREEIADEASLLGREAA
jgi:glycosyltransferase involved in cell wall biosynthesis